MSVATHGTIRDFALSFPCTWNAHLCCFILIFALIVSCSTITTCVIKINVIVRLEDYIIGLYYDKYYIIFIRIYLLKRLFNTIYITDRNSS